MLNELGTAYAVQGDYVNASTYFTQALALVDALPRDDAAELIFNQAVVLQNTGKLQEALALFRTGPRRVSNRRQGRSRAAGPLGNRADALRGRRDGEVARGGE